MYMYIISISISVAVNDTFEEFVSINTLDRIGIVFLLSTTEDMCPSGLSRELLSIVKYIFQPQLFSIKHNSLLYYNIACLKLFQQVIT